MKKEDSMYSGLISLIKTVRDADRLLLEIDALETSLSKPEPLSLISEANAQKIMETFSKNNLDINNKDLYRSFLESLKEIIKKLKVVNLVLAFDPSSKTMDKIHSFISNNIGIGYILDIEVSESILAGAIVICNGRYFDNSLKKSIEDTFATKKQEIQKLMQ